MIIELVDYKHNLFYLFNYYKLKSVKKWKDQFKK